MTYTFKLSRRLAVSRTYPALAAIGILAACTSGGEPLGPAAMGPDISRTVLTPRSSTLEVNQMIQFAAYRRSPGGDSILASDVSWSSDGGQIGVDGKFHALTPGHYRIVGRVSDGQSTPDTATVAVLDTAVAPAPAPAPLIGRNEPAGMAQITERDFNTVAEASWLYSQNSNFGVVHDGSPRPGATDSLVGQIRFPAGFASGSAPAWTDREGLPSTLRFRTTYVSFWVKVSTNWYGQSVVNKIGFVWIGGKPKCDPAIQGGGTGSLYFQLRLQNLAGQPDVNLPNNLGPGTFTRGQWHHVELLLVANSASTAAADGQARWWLDDQPVGSATNIAWVGPGDSDTWEIFAWNPIWGGAGGTIPADQYMWMDQYYASGK